MTANRYCVLGATGFLGRHIVRALLQQGATVRAVIHKTTPPDLQGAELVHADLLSPDSLANAFCDCETVIHTASLCEVAKGWAPYRRINVDGTKNVLQACQKAHVSYLVYTSTPSVVSGNHSILNGDESLPIPKQFIAPYPATKAAAEKLILAANSPKLRTCALRPHLIWGPDDPHILPVIRKSAGHLPIIGDGTNQVSLTHIDNAVHAHLLAAKELHGNGRCAGKAYFINDDAPVVLWDWINAYLQLLGLPPAARHIPRALAYAAGFLAELLGRIPGLPAPHLTRFNVQQLSQSHTFSHAAATRDFGYNMIVDPAEKFQELKTTAN